MRSSTSASPVAGHSSTNFKLILYKKYNGALLRLLTKHQGNVVGCSDSPAVALAIRRISDLRPLIPQAQRREAMIRLSLPDGWPLELPTSCKTLFFDLS